MPACYVSSIMTQAGLEIFLMFFQFAIGIVKRVQIFLRSPNSPIIGVLAPKNAAGTWIPIDCTRIEDNTNTGCRQALDDLNP